MDAGADSDLASLAIDSIHLRTLRSNFHGMNILGNTGLVEELCSSVFIDAGGAWTPSSNHSRMDKVLLSTPGRYLSDDNTLARLVRNCRELGPPTSMSERHLHFHIEQLSSKAELLNIVLLRQSQVSIAYATIGQTDLHNDIVDNLTISLRDVRQAVRVLAARYKR